MGWLSSLVFIALLFNVLPANEKNTCVLWAIYHSQCGQADGSFYCACVEQPGNLFYIYRTT
jgi:hypothetical protein